MQLYSDFFSPYLGEVLLEAAEFAGLLEFFC
jgi:hypothetical protein